jgi:hypothetical protein
MQSRDPDIPGVVIWSDWREALPVWSISVLAFMDHRLVWVVFFHRANVLHIFDFVRVLSVSLLRYDTALEDHNRCYQRVGMRMFIAA